MHRILFNSEGGIIIAIVQGRKQELSDLSTIPQSGRSRAGSEISA